MRLFKIYIIALLLGLSGCIEPVEIAVDKEPRALVVNGLITNAPGPYTVKLNRSYYYGEYYGTVHPDVFGATVTITDSEGFSEVLVQKEPGRFETAANGIVGKIGNSYQLKIKLKNGQEYISEPEELKAVPAIENIATAFTQEHTLDENGVDVLSNMLKVTVDTKDPANEKNFYRWSSVGTYQVLTQPEDYKEKIRGVYVPRPKACCRDCWITDPNNGILVKEDRLFNGQLLTNEPVFKIPATPRYFDIKYRIEISQYSLSEKAYNFWKTMQMQSTGNGSVQDPAPENAVGNMSAVNNPQEKVVGYFGASGVSKKVHIITRADIPVLIQKYVYPDDCRTLPFSTTVKPAFWQ